MEATGISIERNAKGIPTVAHIDLKKYGAELNGFFSSKGIVVEESLYISEDAVKTGQDKQQISDGRFSKLDKHFESKNSEEYTDAEILVYNSMINAANIIAKNT